MSGIVPRANAVALALAVVVSAVAIAVHFVFAATARQILDFPFAGLEPAPETVAVILTTNLRLLIGVIAAIVIVQSPWCAESDGRRSNAGLLVVAGIDTLIGLEVALNAVIIGASLGGYGWRMVLAVFPHGPLELAAFSTVLALYLRSRTEPLTPRTIARGALAGSGLLLAAAVIETYVAL